MSLLDEAGKVEPEEEVLEAGVTDFFLQETKAKEAMISINVMIFFMVWFCNWFINSGAKVLLI